MPTVLLLDNSLSMTRLVRVSDSSEEYQRRHLAILGINCFLDFLASNTKLEFVSLMTFSATSTVVVPFTRDYDLIRSAADKSEVCSKTCIEAALTGVGSMVMDEWGINTLCQVILITDGSTGTGETSLRRSLLTRHQLDGSAVDASFPLPFAFPSRLHIVCLGAGTSEDQRALEELSTLGGCDGVVIKPELTPTSMSRVFGDLAAQKFAPHCATLKFGHLQSAVQLFPAPQPYSCDHDFECVQKTVSTVLEICGFLDIADLSSPPYLSRHLVLPVSDTQSRVKTEAGKDEDEETGEGKTAAFTVLLHGSLKVEGMAALAQLADDWYGILYSWADSKKKSNLMLSVLKPGADNLPWLGNLSHLGPLTSLSSSPYAEDNPPFPVKPVDRKSYAQNCVVWIKQAGVQTDIQKILRSARKLPEKQQHFYKELNRLRKAALAFGFLELLTAVADLLERECTLLPGNAHPAAALQLSHAVTALRSSSPDVNITPLRTNFSAD